MLNIQRFLSLLLCFVLSRTQCCLRMIDNQCVQCPPNFHLFMKNCIMDLPFCQDHVDGFFCAECIEGYRVDQQRTACILQDAPIGTIPTNGFEPIFFGDLNSPTFENILQIANTELGESAELNTAYVRNNQIDPLQIIYRLIFFTEIGIAQAIFTIQNQMENITLVELQEFSIFPNESFVADFNDEIVQRAITEARSIGLQEQRFQGQDFSALEIFVSKRQADGTSSLITEYRILFLNSNFGIIEIRTQIEQIIVDIISETRELDIDNLPPAVSQAIDKIKSDGTIPEQATLVAAFEVILIRNSQEITAYNTSFVEERLGCVWAIFQIQTEEQQLNTVLIAEGECTLEITRPPVLCLLSQVNRSQIDQISLVKVLNLTNFLLGDFSLFRTYLTQCQTLSGDLQSVAIGQNQTILVYELKMQLFVETMEILFLKAFRFRESEEINIIEAFEIPQKQIKQTSFVIGDSPSIDPQLDNVIQMFDTTNQLVPNSSIFLIQIFNFSQNNQQIKRFCFTYAFPNQAPFQKKQFVEIRADQIQGFDDLVMRPSIFTPPEEFSTIDIDPDNIENSGFSEVLNIASNNITENSDVQPDQIVLERFFRNLNEGRPFRFVIYYRVVSELNVYTFSVSGTLILVARVLEDNLNLTPEQIRQDHVFHEMLCFTTLYFEQIKSEQFVLQGGIHKPINNTLQNVTLVFRKDNTSQNITFNHNRQQNTSQIIEILKNVQNEPQEQIDVQSFAQNYQRQFQQYLLLLRYPESQQASTIENIDSVYKGQENITIVDKLNRRIMVSLEPGLPSLHTQFVLSRDISMIDDQEINKILKGLKLEKYEGDAQLIMKQQYKNVQFERYHVKLTLPNSEIYSLVYECSLNSSKLVVISLQNLKYCDIGDKQIQESPKIQLSLAQKRQIQQFLGSQTKIRTVTSIKSLKIIRIIGKSEYYGLVELLLNETHLNNRTNYELFSIKSLDNGFISVGSDYIELIKQKNLLNFNEKIIEETISDLTLPISNIQTQKNYEVSSNNIILWKVKNFELKKAEVQLYYEISTYSTVIKIRYLIIDQEVSTILDFQPITNRYEEIIRNQQNIIDEETKGIKESSIFQNIQNILFKKYWYYLRGSTLLSGYRQMLDGGEKLFLNYQTISRSVHITVQYTFQTEQVQILAIRPSLYQVAQSEEIYRCVRYSSVSDQGCSQCSKGFILDKNKKCLPKLQQCVIQSGDICLWPSSIYI